MTDQEYYEDESKWGEYQYVSLPDLVNDYINSRSADAYDALEPRHKVLYQARQAIAEFNKDLGREIKAVRLSLNALFYAVVPRDFVRPVRISWVTEDNQLVPIPSDSNMIKYQDYLQDHTAEILFDHEGNILEGEVKATNIDTPRRSNFDDCGCTGGFFSQYVFRPNKDNSKSYPKGKYHFDQNKGIIQFSSDIAEKDIVIEYISDGMLLDDSQIKVHKFGRKFVESYIYYKLIEKRRNVAGIEKVRARKEYFNDKRLAKASMASFTKEEFLQAAKGANRWIK